MLVYAHTIPCRLSGTDHSSHLYQEFSTYDTKVYDSRIAVAMKYAVDNILPNIGCEINGDTPEGPVPIINAKSCLSDFKLVQAIKKI